MSTTWARALIDGEIENTMIGYSIASQDRFWFCFIFDLWSEDEFRYNRLYPQGLYSPLTYENYDGALLFRSRLEAEEFAVQWRERLGVDDATYGKVEVYVCNLGDDARYEDVLLGGSKRTRVTPKFKGSEEALAALAEMWRKALE